MKGRKGLLDGESRVVCVFGVKERGAESVGSDGWEGVKRGVWEGTPLKCVRKCVESHGGRRRWEAMGFFGRFREIGGRRYR